LGMSVKALRWPAGRRTRGCCDLRSLENLAFSVFKW
jgi:hypothetical protein